MEQPAKLEGVGEWMEVSGALALKNRDPHDYFWYSRAAQTTEAKSSAAAMQIQKDILRTFPEHERFSLGENGQYPPHSLLRPLTAVLSAFCVRNPVAGYTQGLNFIVGTMMLYVSEEDAFWLLVALSELLFPQFYNESLSGAVVESELVDLLILEKLPVIHAALQAQNLTTQLFSTQWIITLFTADATPAIAARILNVVLRHRPAECILLRLSLSLFRLRRQQLSENASSSASLATAMTQLCRGLSAAEVDKLLAKAQKPSRIVNSFWDTQRQQRLKRERLQQSRFQRIRRVKKLFREFDTDGNGYIDREEFLAMLSHIHGSEADADQSWQTHGLEIFDGSVKDSNGRMNEDAFREAVQLMAPSFSAAMQLTMALPESVIGGTHAKLRCLFDFFDSDSSGELDLSELHCLVSLIHSARLGLSEIVGARGRERFEERSSGEWLVESKMIFAHVDQDHSGTISFDEFVDAARSMPVLGMGLALIQLADGGCSARESEPSDRDVLVHALQQAEQADEALVLTLLNSVQADANLHAVANAIGRDSRIGSIFNGLIKPGGARDAVFYQIEVQTSKARWVAQKRYSDIMKFHHQLCARLVSEGKQQELELLKRVFPKKSMSSTSAATQLERRHAFQEYFNTLLGLHCNYIRPQLQGFLRG
jgi:Ca2+-binding EF-hand superfamily protein